VVSGDVYEGLNDLRERSEASESISTRFTSNIKVETNHETRNETKPGKRRGANERTLWNPPLGYQIPSTVSVHCNRLYVPGASNGDEPRYIEPNEKARRILRTRDHHQCLGKSWRGKRKDGIGDGKEGKKDVPLRLEIPAHPIPKR
jgi:hypothetical protein